jgi:predicted acylesterase/phospholipase RssA
MAKPVRRKTRARAGKRRQVRKAPRKTAPKAAPRRAAQPARRIRILSIDGGGIRGAIPAHFLALLEQDLGSGAAFQAFDYFAGTSAGALIALHIAGNRATAAACDALFEFETARQVMDASIWDRSLPIETEPRYDGRGKRRVLEETFGDRRIQSVAKPVLVTAYDIVQRRVVVFKSAGGSDAAYDPTIAEVADASSAAPTYFPTVETTSIPHRWLVDGGLAANNPAGCALAEAVRNGYAPAEIRIVSLGTGTPTRRSEDGDQLGRDSQGWGAIGWMRNGLIDHFFAANSTTVDYLCRQAIDDRYVRVNGPLTDALDDMDAVTRGNIANLKRMAEAWYAQHRDAVRRAVEA